MDGVDAVAVSVVFDTTVEVEAKAADDNDDVEPTEEGATVDEI